MELNEKLQELRRRKGLTQEALARSLYVSRTAISKWESGRGYPSIESLKLIAAFFSVTVDELISTGEVLELAEAESRQRAGRRRDLVMGALDLCMLLVLFLPLFAARAPEGVQAVSLLALTYVQPYLRVLYILCVSATALTGVLLLALQNCEAAPWLKGKVALSLALSGITVLLLIIGLQPYAAVFALALAAIKLILLFKWG